MARYPWAKFRNIAPGRNDPPIKVIGAILHVDAGNNKSLYNYFNGPSGGVESHFHVPNEGPVEQYRDTGWEADANLKANSFIENGVRKGYVSIETQGLERGEWNEHQLFEIKRLLKWLSEAHDFPLLRCPAHTKPGVGYHTMFGAPGPWAPNAKSCPGPNRIKQFNSVLVPWLKNQGPAPLPVEKDEMTTEQFNALVTKIHQAINQSVSNTKIDMNQTAILENIYGRVDAAIRQAVSNTNIDVQQSETLAVLVGKVDSLAAAVAKLPKD